MKSLPLLLLLFGCAAISDEERYERENSLILAKEYFERRKDACDKSGGTMVIERFGINSPRLTKWEYNRAYCVKRW